MAPANSLWSNMQGRSWHAELPRPQRSELALLRTPNVDFQGNAQIGSMVAAKGVATKFAAAFQKVPHLSHA
jgi:hypothetical protein